MPIRPYRDFDWAAVRDIYDLAKPDEMRGVVEPSAIPRLEVDPDMMTLFRNSEIFVMERGERIVGFGGSRGTFITWLFVHPEHRRTGVAQALVHEFLARRTGTITLNVARPMLLPTISTSVSASRWSVNLSGSSMAMPVQLPSCGMKKRPNPALNATGRYAASFISASAWPVG